MYKYFFVVVFILISNMAFSQTYYPYQDIVLENPTDYVETEPLALSAAKFIMSTPFSEKNLGIGKAFQFLSKWVLGAKAYNFYLKGKIMDLSADNNIFSLYIAAMVKYSLENKTEAVNPMKVELNSSRLVLDYCNDAKNNFKLKKKYRKLLETN